MQSRSAKEITLVLSQGEAEAIKSFVGSMLPQFYREGGNDGYAGVLDDLFEHLTTELR